MPLLRVPSNSTASSVPPMVPLPPAMMAPPKKTAVMTSSSSPWLPEAGCPELVRAVRMSPPIPDSAPEMP